MRPGRAANDLQVSLCSGEAGPCPGPRPHLPPPPRPHRLHLCHTLDGGLGLAAIVAGGADRAAGAGRAWCHPHAQPFQVPEAVGEGLRLVLQLLPVPCRACGARQWLVPERLGDRNASLSWEVLPEVQPETSVGTILR